jgi:hypothetical protein
MVARERGLNGMQRSIGRCDAFNGLDAAAIGLHGEHEAGAHGGAIHQHGASAADAMFAADMRAGERQLLAQEIRQMHARINCRFHHAPVDAELDGAWVKHGRGLPRA